MTEQNIKQLEFGAQLNQEFENLAVIARELLLMSFI